MGVLVKRGGLADRCRASFSDAALRAGEAILRRGDVSVPESGPDGNLVLVGEDLDTEVVIDFDIHDRVVYVRCDCMALGSPLCEHAWAGILQLESEGISPKFRGDGDLNLIVFGVDEGEDYGYDDDDEEFHGRFGFESRPRRAPPARTPARPDAGKEWQKRLSYVAQANHPLHHTDRPPDEVWYLIDLDASVQHGRLAISLHQRQRRQNGQLGSLKDLTLSESEIRPWPASPDREILACLTTARSLESMYQFSYRPSRAQTWFVPPAMYDFLLPRICDSQRCGHLERIRSVDALPAPLAWDPGPAWKFQLAVEPAKNAWEVSGKLVRGDEEGSLAEPLAMLFEGLLIFPDRLARYQHDWTDRWVESLRNQGPFVVPKSAEREFVTRLWSFPAAAEWKLPEPLQMTPVSIQPTPTARFSASGSGRKPVLDVHLQFDYRGQSVSWRDAGQNLVVPETREVLLRDRVAETEAMNLLYAQGVKSDEYGERLRLSNNALPRVVQQLVAQGWQVEAEGKLLRRAGSVHLSVKSNIDWFELTGTVEFDGASASLPELLAALRRGEKYVQLGDGTHGMLPEEWLAKYAPLAEMGQAEGEQIRFKPTQALILDALLAAQPGADVDAAFDKARQRLRSFAGIQAIQEPDGFRGELRNYQREGLGWFAFLRDFGFGGCLADDMGLGKTVQVLAMLDARRREVRKKDRRPSLAVVPRSLVRNWMLEAEKFAPGLQVLDYSVTQRSELAEKMAQADLVLSTYGTLRRDVIDLKEIHFDYVILDESQAIKNSDSQSAKAVRLLNARHRLAMTGTPVENSLGDLWSLFEFLNPGMLGKSAALNLASRAAGEPETRQLLAQSLRPFLLRRTKEQVLPELPEKFEQTLVCELDKKQRKQYDDLKKHYQQLLSQKIAQGGLNRAKIHVLEALLRLRQAACHPGLLDAKHQDAESAKFETLFEKIDEVRSEGHKALVFSQFTSLLALARRRLDRGKVTYEYLDGKTARRQDKVDRFQNDPKCQLFLISLKAGGYGLNLTAADYVFILDPWWNPAVEAQAVDRAHRIGQDKRVFAYRLIAKDTVEEKVLELQRSKRELAEAIVSADNSLLSNLTADDLQLLLS